MELWFWLAIYDYRWFIYPFDSKYFYQFVWLLPLLYNLIFIPIPLYNMQLPNIYCQNEFTHQIYARLAFCALLSLFIVIFMVNISIVNSKEIKYYENLKKIYSDLDTTVLPNFSFWTRNKILNGGIGITLLVLSCLNIIWALYFKNYINVYGDNCNYNLVRFLDIHSMITIIGALPVGFLFFTNFFIKVVCIIMSVTCPRVMVKCSLFVDRGLCKSKAVSKRVTFKKREMIYK